MFGRRKTSQSHLSDPLTILVKPGVRTLPWFTMKLRFDTTKVVRHASLSDVEILLASAFLALAPWIDLTHGQLTRHLPTMEAIGAALTAQSHASPLFDGAFGFIQAEAGKDWNAFDRFDTGPDKAVMALPSGQISINGHDLLAPRSRNHFLAYGSEPLPASFRTAKASLALINFKVATLLASHERGLGLSPSHEPEPEAFHRAVGAFATGMKPTPHDIGSSLRTAERAASIIGILREDPTPAEGSAWKPGPAYAKALSLCPATVLDAAEMMVKAFDGIGDGVIDAFVAVASDAIGPGYAGSRAPKHQRDHSGHELLEALPILERLDGIAAMLAGDPAATAFLRNHQPW